MCSVKNCCDDYDNMLLSIVNVGVNDHIIVGLMLRFMLTLLLMLMFMYT